VAGVQDLDWNITHQYDDVYLNCQMSQNYRVELCMTWCLRAQLFKGLIVSRLHCAGSDSGGAKLCSARSYLYPLSHPQYSLSPDPWYSLLWYCLLALAILVVMVYY
jgi:hypothetical protein